MIRQLLCCCVVMCMLCAGAPLPCEALTLRFGVTDVLGQQRLETEWGPFVAALKEVAGIELELVPMDKRDDAIRGFASKSLDLALSGPAEYVVIRKRTKATALVGFSRPDYFSVIVALSNGPFKSISALKGQKVAFYSVGSTSGHLAPMQVLKDRGIDPLRDIIAVHATTKPGWEALLRGNVAAMGTSNAYFVRLRDQASNHTPGDFTVLARSGDLPGDVLMVGAHVSDSDALAFKQALLTHSKALIDAITTSPENEKYRGMQFLRNTKDADYDTIRAMYATVGFPAYSDFF